MTIASYIRWHYTIAPRQLLGVLHNYIVATWHIFYITNHLRTLFRPWHRMQQKLTFQSIWEKIILGLVDRFVDFLLLIIAAIIRLSVIITGLIVTTLVCITFVLILIGWVAWPAWYILFLSIGLGNLTSLMGIASLIAAFGVTELSIKLFKNYQYGRPIHINVNGQKLVINYSAGIIVKKRKNSEEFIKALISSPAISFMLRRLNVSSEAVLEAAKDITTENHNPNTTLEQAARYTKDTEAIKITAEDIFMAMANQEPLRSFWYSLQIEPEDLYLLAHWSKNIRAQSEYNRRFWDLERLLRTTPIGQTWTYGFTPNLDIFTRSVVAKESRRSRKKPELLALVGRRTEIDVIERTLSKTGENNILLVGTPGIGKEAIIRVFASLIASGKTLPTLDYKRVVRLNIPLLTSTFKNVPDIQEGLTRILNEAQRAGNIILVINDLHNFVGAADLGIGKIDIAEILVPYIKSNRFQVIATTDPMNFHKYIRNRPDLMEILTTITIEEPSLADTITILTQAVPRIERDHRVFITFPALKSATVLADKYIHTAPFPEKAINLLHETVALVNKQKKKIVEVSDVETATSQLVNIPIGPRSEADKEKLLNLEQIIHRKLVNQEAAVTVIAESLRRAQAGLSGRHRPIGSFLFIGPTGVGKTQTAKVLAEQYFGSEERMIRFDMAEYQDVSGIERFIGSSQRNEPGQFVSQARDNPFSVILLDEIEKANPKIIDIFLPVLDEGYIKDTYGQRVNLEQSIIIATSNAGSELIRQMVRKGDDPNAEKEKIIEYLMQNGYFKPEFLNRFDAVVVYKPLSKEHLLNIAELMLGDLQQRLKLQGYQFVITDDIKEFVVAKGYNPQFGSRPMKRAIQDYVENKISKMIIGNELKRGQSFFLSSKQLEK